MRSDRRWRRWPYLWLDATYLKQREGGRIVSVAAIIAMAVNTDGKREIVGCISAPRSRDFWLSSQEPGRRGLRGKLVISDAQRAEGGDPARFGYVATLPRHWMRNALPMWQTQQSMVRALRQASSSRTRQASQMLRHVADQLRRSGRTGALSTRARPTSVYWISRAAPQQVARTNRWSE